MAENTKIEWAHHTFNPWEGCAKVSPGCKNCYAEGQHRFMYASLGKGDNPGTCWGVNAPRLARSDDNWKKPLKWNAEAERLGVRYRVFCASMADVFEEQSEASRAFAGQTARVPTGPEKWRTVTFVDIAQERLRLLRLIHDTPHLDWLLLTKRPDNIQPALFKVWKEAHNQADVVSGLFEWINDWTDGLAPANVWLGTSVENQEQADIRVPQLLAAPAALRFLSCEPLLGPVNLGFNLGHKLTKKPDSIFFEYDEWYDRPHYICENGHIYTIRIKSEALGRDACYDCMGTLKAWKPGVDWVIVGGESGPKARPMHPEWVRGLRDQCAAAKVPMLFKQWGAYGGGATSMSTGAQVVREFEDFGHWVNKASTWVNGGICLSTSGQQLKIGADFMAARDARQFPVAVLHRMDKHEAGRELDGQIHDEFPVVKLS